MKLSYKIKLRNLFFMLLMVAAKFSADLADRISRLFDVESINIFRDAFKYQIAKYETKDVIVRTPIYKGSCNEKCITPPNIKKYQIENGRVLCGTSSFASRDRLYIEEYELKKNISGVVNYASGALCYHNEELAFLKIKKEARLSGTWLSLTGNGDMNYYHFLIELVTKIFYFKNRVNIIINKEVLYSPNFISILELLTKDRVDKIFYLDNNVALTVENLLYITSPNKVVYNKPKMCLEIDDFYYTKESLIWIRERALANCKASVLNVGKKVFLSRKSMKYRKYNQDEVAKVFADMGFSIICLEDYTFEEQVSIFHKAEFIAGPTGASWTNIIFTKQCKCYSWILDEQMDFSLFSSLGIIGGSSIEALDIVINSRNNDIQSDYIVDIEKLKKIIRFKFE